MASGNRETPGEIEASLEAWVEVAPGTDVDRLLSREWIEANGLGGWASSTFAGLNTRRYHGLLVPAVTPPLGRIVLLSKLDETVTDGATRTDLASNRYPGVIAPAGWALLRRWKRGIFVESEYASDGWTISRQIAAIHGENTTVVTWTLDGELPKVVLELRPFLAGRDYHGLARANDFVRRRGEFDDGLFSIEMYDGIPPLHVAVPGSTMDEAPDWYYDFVYERESDRGLDDREDLFTPGVLRVELRRGEPLAAVVTTNPSSARLDGRALVARERARRLALLPSTHSSPLVDRLALAADQFIVRRGESGRTIIAGYHWFGDWGRDTMIALPGLTLATARIDDARAILNEFASVVSDGMLPNRFPDHGDVPEYNTVDATLWFFLAIHRTVQASGDRELGRRLLPVLEDIVSWHERGTRHGIRVDEDGLLRAGASGVQLTWMDAKVGDLVVTPREGKAVEINALWYNALLVLAALRRESGAETAARDAVGRAERVRERFNEVFWNEMDGALFDVVNGEARDASVRPNQIFAISLPFPLLTGSRAESVLGVVEQRLLTPVGLRSLAPGDSRYAPVYAGGPQDRDRIYHQGTVWSWLLGPYLTALVRIRGDAGRVEARRILDKFESHLREAGVGSVSEIFDAEPPFAPKGCIAQAWGVGEILRAAVELRTTESES